MVVVGVGDTLVVLVAVGLPSLGEGCDDGAGHAESPNTIEALSVTSRTRCICMRPMLLMCLGMGGRMVGRIPV